MKVTVATVTDYTFTLEVPEDLELENFKAFCEVETGLPAVEIICMFKGQCTVLRLFFLRVHLCVTLNTNSLCFFFNLQNARLQLFALSCRSPTHGR